MSAESSPEIQKLQVAKKFLDGVFPDALIIVPANVEGTVRRRMDAAGIGLAEIILEDGSMQQATYIFEETPITKAIEHIWEDEQAGVLPPGSHENAMDSILNGEFYHQWGGYLPW